MIWHASASTFGLGEGVSILQPMIFPVESMSVWMTGWNADWLPDASEKG
jgi:hypothetical protein